MVFPYTNEASLNYYKELAGLIAPGDSLSGDRPSEETDPSTPTLSPSEGERGVGGSAQPSSVAGLSARAKAVLRFACRRTPRRRGYRAGVAAGGKSAQI